MEHSNSDRFVNQLSHKNMPSASLYISVQINTILRSVTESTHFHKKQTTTTTHFFLKNIKSPTSNNIANQNPFSRLTETARLLRNVRNVFSRRSNTRVNMEIELSREYEQQNDWVHRLHHTLSHTKLKWHLVHLSFFSANVVNEYGGNNKRFGSL